MCHHADPCFKDRPPLVQVFGLLVWYTQVWYYNNNYYDNFYMSYTRSLAVIQLSDGFIC